MGPPASGFPKLCPQLLLEMTTDLSDVQDSLKCKPEMAPKNWITYSVNQSVHKYVFSTTMCQGLGSLVRKYSLFTSLSILQVLKEEWMSLSLRPASLPHPSTRANLPLWRRKEAQTHYTMEPSRATNNVFSSSSFSLPLYSVYSK